MKKIIVLFFSLIFVSSLLSCKEEIQEEEIDYSINMNTDFPIVDCLEDGKNTKTKVIVLLGQSNASGCSYVSYLEKNLSAEEFNKYQSGFNNVLINYCIDNQSYTTSGSFKPVDLTCGVKPGYFGPELGIAEKLSSSYKDEIIFMLKFTMSGYSLNHHWLSNKNRGDIYNACLIYLTTYLDYLKSKNYDISLNAICWMQGESDTTDAKAAKYYDNTVAFVSYLREDLKEYNSQNKIYFIDAGISSSPYCLPAYPKINESKVLFSQQSNLNIYFPTIENGLTTLYEPYENPDLGHYDSLDELKLGHLFGDNILSIYE